MSIYISPALSRPGATSHRQNSICYMISDTLSELVKMANRLDLNEFDLSEIKGVDCYILSMRDRAVAADNGAKLASREEFYHNLLPRLRGDGHGKHNPGKLYNKPH